MSLLDSDNEEYGEEEQVFPSHTDDLLFGETSSRGRAKKAERKARAEEKKASSKPVYWSKHKENVVQEKTPKKPKSQSAARVTPPDSPKSLRPLDAKGNKGGAGTVAQLQQPSPNIKNQRKRYSQLGAESSSEEGGEEEDFLFSNKPALRGETVARGNLLDQSSNPFLGDWPLLPGAPPTCQTSSVSALPLFPTCAIATGAAVSKIHQHDQPWLPSSTQTTAQPYLFHPDLSSSNSGRGGAVERKLSPTHLANIQDLSVTSVTNPFLSANLFTAVTPPMPSVLPPSFTAPPPPATAPPTVPPPNHSSLSYQQSSFQDTPSPPTEEEWSISGDLQTKCMQQFKELEPVNGLLQGDKAREFFVQSKLPFQELSAIWYKHMHNL